MNAFIGYFIYGQVLWRPPPEPMTPRPTRPPSFIDPLSSSSQAINRWPEPFIWDRSPSSSRQDYNLDDGIELSPYGWEETHSGSIRRRIDREEEHCLQDYTSGHRHDLCKALRKHDSEGGISTVAHRAQESIESSGSVTGRRSRSASPGIIRVEKLGASMNRPRSCGEVERRRRNGRRGEE